MAPITFTKKRRPLAHPAANPDQDTSRKRLRSMPRHICSNTYFQQPFRLLDLPAELREEILLQVILAESGDPPPVDTAAISGTPDRVNIPAVAHVSRLLRKESLGVFYQHRTLVISLFCQANVSRFKSWMQKWSVHVKEFRQVTIRGKLEPAGDFYDIHLRGLKHEPWFAIEQGPTCSAHITHAADGRLIPAVRARLKLTTRKSDADDKGKLQGPELRAVVTCVIQLASPSLLVPQS